MAFANLTIREELLVMKRGDGAEPDSEIIATYQDKSAFGVRSFSIRNRP